MNAAYTGNQIAARRKALGMTQKDLAEKLHVTDKAVSKWERGLNFPDLGLMEALAEALETTPATLLGLEKAGREEIVSTMTEISAEQLEDAHRDIRQIGWVSIGSAVLLVMAYVLFGNDVRQTQIAYQLQHGLIMLFSLGGLYILVKYSEIKKFDLTDTLTLYAAAIPLLIYLGIQFFTGHSPHPILGFCLIAVSACFVQLLFYRVMRPPLVKALPMILSAAFLLWHLWEGTFVMTFITPAVCCLTVWCLCRIRKIK